MDRQVDFGTAQGDLELRKLSYMESLARLRLEERKAELAVEITQYGLKGTLTGAIGGLILVTVLAVMGSFEPGLGINGLHLTLIIAILCTTVGIYGAFVFNRSTKFAARFGANEFQAGTLDQDTDNGEPDRKSE